MTEVMFNLAYYQYSDHWQILEMLLKPQRFIAINEIPAFPVDCRNHNGLGGILASMGFNPISVDITSPDVSELGWMVIRIVVPGLIPNFPASYPPLGLSRIQVESARAGKDCITTMPVPYS
jgi:hypothetical protein